MKRIVIPIVLGSILGIIIGAIAAYFAPFGYEGVYWFLISTVAITVAIFLFTLPEKGD